MTMIQASQIREKLEELQDLPATVSDWQVEIGHDSTGDPAIWIWAILSSESLSRHVQAELQQRIRGAVHDLEVDTSFWPYVRFRSAKEVSEV